MERSPVVRPDSITAGYWAHSAEHGWLLRQPFDDPMTPLFDAVWTQVMGRHSDTDRDGVVDQSGVVDPTIPTPDHEDDHIGDSVCGFAVDRTGDDWPAPPGAVDADGNPGSN